jgi:hypothetical protein
MGVSSKTPLHFLLNPAGQNLCFVYFGLSGVLTESKRPGISIGEVFHQMKQCQRKGEARVHASAMIGLTTRPSFLATW